MPDLGEIAYNAYREKRSAAAWSGAWTWAQLEEKFPETAKAWSAAAEAVVAELHRLDGE